MLYNFTWDFSADLSTGVSYIHILNVEIAICRFRYDANTKTLFIEAINIPEDLQGKKYATDIYHQLLGKFPIDRIESCYTEVNFSVYLLERDNQKTHQEAILLTPSGKIISRTGAFILSSFQATQFYVDVVWIRKQ